MALLPPDPLYLLRGNMGPVHSLLFRLSPYFEHLYTGTESGKIHVWDLRKNREISKLDTPTGEKDTCLTMRMIDEEHLLTQRKSGRIDLWTANASQWILTKSYGDDPLINSPHCSFCRCQLLTDNDIHGDTVLIPLKDSVIGLLSLKTFQVESKLDPATLDIADNDNLPRNSLGETMVIKAFGSSKSTNNSDQYVLVAYESGDVALWDMKQKNVLSWLKPETECPMAMDFDDSNMRGIIGSASDKLQIFDLSRSQKLSSRSTLTLKNPGTSVITIRHTPDNKVFTAGGWDGRLRIFSWKTLRPLAVLDQHHGAVIHDICYSRSKIEAYGNACVMAAAGKDGNVSLWDLYN